jgi:hypothetical protein
VYEAAGVAMARETRIEGERIVRAISKRNAIPAAILRADVEDPEKWHAEAWAAIDGLLGGRRSRGDTLSST